MVKNLLVVQLNPSCLLTVVLSSQEKDVFRTRSKEGRKNKIKLVVIYL
jgi:hypothetical protein